MSKAQTLSNRKAELDAIARMNQSPHPMPIFKHNQMVYVLRNSSWSKAKIVTSSQNGCQVQLIESKEAFNLYDARCIRPA